MEPTPTTLGPLGEQAVLPAANLLVPTRILAAMHPGRDYSRAELLADTGISEADWSWAIRQLKEQGKVVQRGRREWRGIGSERPEGIGENVGGVPEKFS